MQLKLSDFGKDIVEILEENVSLLTVQDVMIADDSTGLHSKL